MTVLTAYAPLILAIVCGVILVGAGWLVFRWGYREGNKRSDYEGAMHEVGELVRVLNEIISHGRNPQTAQEWLRLNFPREIAAANERRAHCKGDNA